MVIFLTPLLWAIALVLGRIVGAGAPEVHLDFLVPVAAIGEEFGWRGYALPRLQRRMKPIPASLLIGVIWAGWHLPYYAYPEIHPLPFVERRVILLDKVVERRGRHVGVPPNRDGQLCSASPSTMRRQLA